MAHEVGVRGGLRGSSGVSRVGRRRCFVAEKLSRSDNSQTISCLTFVGCVVNALDAGRPRGEVRAD